MTVYLVDIQRRKDHGSTLGPFSTWDKAIAAMKRHLRWKEGDPLTDEFGGNLVEGTYYSEEESLEVHKREVE